MREKLQNLFNGRQGMDELSKSMFWWGLAGILLSVLLDSFVGGVFGSIIRFLFILLLVLSFVRAFSTRIPQRETENEIYLLYLSNRARDFEGKKERFKQRREFKFFKCPGCGMMIRVPRGKGKIHINCRCGYSLYRKT